MNNNLVITAAEIKKQLKARFGIAASVTTSPTKHPFIGARIRPLKELLKTFHAPLAYPCEFPPAFRRACLEAVYGPNSSLSKQTIAGNVRQYDIALHAPEWVRAFEIYDRDMATGLTVQEELARCANP